MSFCAHLQPLPPWRPLWPASARRLHIPSFSDRRVPSSADAAIVTAGPGGVGSDQGAHIGHAHHVRACGPWCRWGGGGVLRHRAGGPGTFCSRAASLWALKPEPRGGEEAATNAAAGGRGGRDAGDGPGGGGEEEELLAICAGPVLADSRERVPTPRVSTTRIGMQEHRLDQPRPSRA